MNNLIKRAATLILAAVMIIAGTTSSVMAAFNDSINQVCESQTDGYYVSSDGNYYVYGNAIHRMIYNADNTFTYHEESLPAMDVTSTTYAKEKYQIVDDDGNTRLAYCIQAEAQYVSKEGFTSSDPSIDVFFNLLPDTAKEGIMYSMLYGYSEGKASPVAGTNIDDYKYATQIIIWEYQQQLRTDAYSRKDHSFFDEDTQTIKTIPADEFYNTLKGRPAELCYNWILTQIQNHVVAPSFTYDTNQKAKNNPYTMKYDSATGKYTLTLTDTDNVGKDIKLDQAGISVTRNGNKYTFTTTNTISTPTCVKAQKSVTEAPQMLIWGAVGAQVLATGADDPFEFYVYMNTEPNGTGKIVKTSEDGNVSGITFTITGNGETKTVTTGTDGSVSVSLLPGTYTVTETVADKYVKPQSQTLTITGGQTTTINFTNTLKKFQVSISKQDSSTGNAQGDGSLSGAVYGLYKAGTLVEKLTTGADGKATSGYYTCGTDYTIKEITPPAGYELDTRTYTVGAAPGNFTLERNTISMSFTDNVIKGNISIIKHSDDGSTQIDTPEEGAVFEIYLKSAGSYAAAADSERDVITTDADGFAQSKDLPYGTYTVHQTAGLPNREFIRDFDVVISADKTYRYLINNADFYSYVRIVKTDAETGEVVPYAGAGFKIFDPSGNPVTFKVTYPVFETIDTFYTSSDGTLITPDVLPSGEGYSIVEVEAPLGYVLNSEPIYFDVTRGGSEDYNGINVVTVTRDNMPQKGQITVKKTGEVFSSVVKENGVYKPIYEARAFADAVYEIYAAEDITTPDGTVRYNQGELVDTLTTGEDGTDTSIELYLGTYEVVEAKAPYGLLIDPTPKQVTLTYAGEDISLTSTSETMHNERQKLVISGLKSMSIDEKFGIGGADELLSVSFGLYAAEDIVAADGSVIPADGLMEIIKVKDDGSITATADLPFGKYYLQEITTHAAYILDTTKYPVDFTYAGEDVSEVKVMVNSGITIVNHLYYGDIKGIKTDDGNNPLGGAIFGLFKASEKDFTEDNALMTATSGTDGYFEFKQVPCGAYKVVELKAPEGYIKSDEVINVTINQGEIPKDLNIVNVDAGYINTGFLDVLVVSVVVMINFGVFGVMVLVLLKLKYSDEQQEKVTDERN